MLTLLILIIFTCVQFDRVETIKETIQNFCQKYLILVMMPAIGSGFTRDSFLGLNGEYSSRIVGFTYFQTGRDFQGERKLAFIEHIRSSKHFLEPIHTCILSINLDNMLVAYSSIYQGN